MPKLPERSNMDSALSVDQWLSYFTFGGLQYPFIPTQTLIGNREDIGNSFAGYVTGAYKSNGVVFACMVARMMLFSEARLIFRQRRNGRAGDLIGDKSLALVEHPWPGATTGDLLARAISDVDLAGNAYIARRGGMLKRLRPDWVTIVIGTQASLKSIETMDSFTAGDIEAQTLGYIYHPGGTGSGLEYEVLGADEVAHFAPIPDPTASFRGMSWITPILREIMSDSAATTHKMKFFENGATVNNVVTLDPAIKQEQFDKWVDRFEQNHKGVLNAYKTVYLGGGATMVPVGSNFREMEFKVTQGAGETRICAAARVPPIIVGLSEGLQAATYSNYAQACRAFANITLRPLWRNFCGSMEVVLPPPPRTELWYDDRDIAFLQEDKTDLAAIQASQATTIRSLVDAGFDPDTVVKAVVANDFTILHHSGLYSVQLQQPGEPGEPGGPSLTAPAPTATTAPAATQPAKARPASSNGKKPAATTQGA